GRVGDHLEGRLADGLLVRRKPGHGSRHRRDAEHRLLRDDEPGAPAHHLGKVAGGAVAESDTYRQLHRERCDHAAYRTDGTENRRGVPCAIADPPLSPLSPDFAETRDALHRLAVYVISPAQRIAT